MTTARAGAVQDIGDCERCDKFKNVPLHKNSFSMCLEDQSFTVDVMICAECCMDCLLNGMFGGNANTSIEDLVIQRLDEKYGPKKSTGAGLWEGKES